METNGAKFLQDIENLSANGGDCPELTFTGILDAMRSEPEPGSPMYVFTDATAKDATDDNITEATVYAKFERIPINSLQLISVEDRAISHLKISPGRRAATCLNSPHRVT